MNKTLNIVCVFLTLVLVFGCTTNITPQPVEKELLAVGQKSGILGIYPNISSYETTTIGVNSNIFSGLVEFDKNYVIRSGIAEYWQNPDKLTWLFTLRKDIQFHNGDILTAEDVKYSFELHMNNPDSFLNEQLGMIDSITVKGPYEIEIKTKEPSPVLLNRITDIYIISKKAYEQDPQVVVGTGAYTIKEYVPNDHITLERFDSYWGKKPAVKEVIFRFIEDDNQRTADYVEGKLDIADFLPLEKVSDLQSNANLRIIPSTTTRIMYLGLDVRETESPCFGNKTNPLSDIRVRKAMYYAIDEASIIKNIMGGYAEPATQFVTPTIFGYVPTIKRLPYDLEKAKALMEEAGYEAGFDIALDCTNDRYLNDGAICENIVSQLSSINIKVTANAMAMDNYFEKIFSVGTCFYLLGWSADADGGEIFDYLLTTNNEETGTGPYNFGYYSNALVDELAQNVSQTLNPQERQAYMQRGFSIAAEDVAWIPLHTEQIYYGVANDIVWHPRSSAIIKIEDMEFE